MYAISQEESICNNLLESKYITVIIIIVIIVITQYYTYTILCTLFRKKIANL